MNPTDEVIRKALQQAQLEHGMPREQVFCEHDFDSPFVYQVVPEILERKCQKCGLRLHSRIVWEKLS